MEIFSLKKSLFQRFQYGRNKKYPRASNTYYDKFLHPTHPQILNHGASSVTHNENSYEYENPKKKAKTSEDAEYIGRVLGIALKTFRSF